MLWGAICSCGKRARETGTHAQTARGAVCACEQVPRGGRGCAIRGATQEPAGTSKRGGEGACRPPCNHGGWESRWIRSSFVVVATVPYLVYTRWVYGHGAGEQEKGAKPAKARLGECGGYADRVGVKAAAQERERAARAQRARDGARAASAQLYVRRQGTRGVAGRGAPLEEGVP